MSFFKRIFGVISKPKDTLSEVSAAAPIWQGISVLVVTGLLPILFLFNQDLFIKNLGAVSSPYTINQMMMLMPVIMVFSVFGVMILRPIFHFVSTSIFHLLAGFFGYKSDGKGLFSSLAFANFPSILSSIIYLILLALNLTPISIIFSLGIMVWVIVLKILAIKYSYSMSGGKATLIYFLPTITIIAIIGIMILLGIFSLAPIMGMLEETIGMSM